MSIGIIYFVLPWKLDQLGAVAGEYGARKNQFGHRDSLSPATKKEQENKRKKSLRSKLDRGAYENEITGSLFLVRSFAEKIGQALQLNRMRESSALISRGLMVLIFDRTHF